MTLSRFYSIHRPPHFDPQSPSSQLPFLNRWAEQWVNGWHHDTNSCYTQKSYLRTIIQQQLAAALWDYTELQETSHEWINEQTNGENEFIKRTEHKNL